jgi:putative lipoprotein
MCPAAPLNDRLAKDWQYVRSYIMKDGHLFLSLMADGGIYEFEPMAPDRGAAATVKGTATYRERMALPPNAVFESTLEDVSRADGPAEIIGQTRVEHPGNPPIAFQIEYDPSRIVPSHSYAVRGRILVNGNLLFTSDQQYAVITAGQGNSVEMLLRRAAASLENTYWKLMSLGDVSLTAASQQEPHLVLDSQSSRVSGMTGCNRLTGSYKLDGDRVSFSETAGTMMACLQGMDTEKQFLDTLGKAAKWQITGDTLTLFDNAGKTVATFDARRMN